MNQFDIEAYLEGGLNEHERQAFEEAMERDNDFAQTVRLQKMLAGDLKTQLLREHITSTLADDSSGGQMEGGPKGLPWRTIIGGFALLLIALAGLFLVNKTEAPAPATDPTTPPKEAPATESPTAPASEEAQKEPAIGTFPTEKQPPAPPAKKENKTKKNKTPVQDRPIAEAQPLPDLRPPFHPSPNVRGSSKEDTVQKALLDAIWYTNFPPANANFQPPLDKPFDLLKGRDFTSAYVRLNLLERKMPESDSLFFLKAYALLEMGEGVEAFNYLSKIKQAPADWQPYLDWYKGLAYLLTNDKAQATTVFKNIKRQAAHPFREESIKALELLK